MSYGNKEVLDMDFAEENEVKNLNNLHRVLIDNQESLHLQGVCKVENFDPCSIWLETNRGDLVIEGEELHIAHLDLDGKELKVCGKICGVRYAVNNKDGKRVKAAGKHLLDRLLK